MWMVVVLVTVAIFTAICAGVVMLLWVTQFTSIWIDERKSADIRIKLKQFVSFYNICPDMFSLDDYCVHYKSKRRAYITICFGYIDTIRYIWWRRRVKRESKVRKNEKVMATFLEEMKTNIEDFLEGQ